EEEEYLDALLLKAELELAAEDDQAVAETLAEIPAEVSLEPDAHLRIADCLREIGRGADALPHYPALLEEQPDSAAAAEARYRLALIAAADGDEPTMRQHFLEVLAYDRRQPPGPHALSVDRIEALVDAALGELPDRARQLLANVPIMVEDLPARELVA